LDVQTVLRLGIRRLGESGAYPGYAFVGLRLKLRSVRLGACAVGSDNGVPMCHPLLVFRLNVGHPLPDDLVDAVGRIALPLLLRGDVLLRRSNSFVDALSACAVLPADLGLLLLKLLLPSLGLPRLLKRLFLLTHSRGLLSRLLLLFASFLRLA
jgi:hypothetical protein